MSNMMVEVTGSEAEVTRFQTSYLARFADWSSDVFKADRETPDHLWFWRRGHPHKELWIELGKDYPALTFVISGVDSQVAPPAAFEVRVEAGRVVAQEYYDSDYDETAA
jgi:hypothetical protein